MTYPSIHPTGVTIYDPARCWNGYTVFKEKRWGAAHRHDGGEVQLWKELHGMPNRILPGAPHRQHRRTQYGLRQPGRIDLIQVDWDGNIVWRFNQYEFIEDPGEERSGWRASTTTTSARQPVGY